MPNHVHLILVPVTADGLACAIGETHRQYTGFVNARQRWTGHLFQGGSPPSCWTRSTGPPLFVPMNTPVNPAKEAGNGATIRADAS